AELKEAYLTKRAKQEMLAKENTPLISDNKDKPTDDISSPSEQTNSQKSISLEKSKEEKCIDPDLESKRLYQLQRKELLAKKRSEYKKAIADKKNDSKDGDPIRETTLKLYELAKF